MKLLRIVTNWRLILVLTIVFLIGLNIILQTYNTLKSGERLDRATQQLKILEQKNQQLRKKLAEVNSPIFLEEQARDKLGLAKEGETVIIIPDSEINKILGITKPEDEVRLPNAQGWLRLFFR